MMVIGRFVISADENTCRSSMPAGILDVDTVTAFEYVMSRCKVRYADYSSLLEHIENAVEEKFQRRMRPVGTLILPIMPRAVTGGKAVVTVQFENGVANILSFAAISGKTKLRWKLDNEETDKYINSIYHGKSGEKWGALK